MLPNATNSFAYKMLCITLNYGQSSIITFSCGASLKISCVNTYKVPFKYFLYPFPSKKLLIINDLYKLILYCDCDRCISLNKMVHSSFFFTIKQKCCFEIYVTEIILAVSLSLFKMICISSEY